VNKFLAESHSLGDITVTEPVKLIEAEFPLKKETVTQRVCYDLAYSLDKINELEIEKRKIIVSVTH